MTGQRHVYVVHQFVVGVDDAIVQVGRIGAVVEEQQLAGVLVGLRVGRHAGARHPW
jgi:hypothetical protein